MARRSMLVLSILLLSGMITSTLANSSRSAITASPSGATTYTALGQVVAASAVRPGQAIDQLSSVQAASAAVAMSEGFEAAWPAPNWAIADLSTTDGGEYMWGKRNCAPRTGAFGAWTVGGGAQGSGLACGTNYPNNARVRALFGPFSLSKATSANLTYHIRGRTEGGAACPFDYLGVASGTSLSGTFTGNAPECGDLTSGAAGNGYYQRTLNLNAKLGQSQVWVAFFFVSDMTNTDIGINVDDITLNIVSTEDSTTTATASTTTTATATGSPSPTSPPANAPTPGDVYLPWLTKQNPPTPTPTITATPIVNLTPTPTSQPGAAKTYYLCYDDQRSPKEFLSQQACSWNNIQLFVYAGTSLASRSFELPLATDIAGTAYSFEVLLASRGTTSFVVSALVRRNGVETTLASSTFTAHSTTFEDFKATVQGIDPSTTNGDVLVVRIQSTSGSDAAIMITQSHQTFLKIQ